jgi:hypothetical protein
MDYEMNSSLPLNPEFFAERFELNDDYFKTLQYDLIFQELNLSFTKVL